MPQNPNDAMWDPRPRLEPVSEDESPEAPADTGGVMVELASGPGMSPVAALDVARRLGVEGFTLDEESGVTPMGAGSGNETYVVKGHVADEKVVTALEQDARVVKVWPDGTVAPF
jgi:hypothetical protein